ncbi:hypothetical protein A9Z42_0025390 [Trichoderma parareesei]|uniref:Uncharacterized protein n=1 Tax=Trichoderma parareesei TaxID=858221 RepID=A0A2H2ZFW0_TRIPA|nr:hypothetical protein A9Z42_0025390 [Trichoderma parareesei]
MAGRRRRETRARYIVFRHAARVQRFLASLEDDRRLKPGHQQLHSFVVPGLQGGKHTVDVTQDITAKSVPKQLTATQEFYVDTPEFAIPEGEIHSVYPPPGHEERSEALPHVVFNTPEFPWEWRASYIEDPPDYKQNRNRVPWLAVLVFTKDELQLSPEDLQGGASIFRNTEKLAGGAKQTSTLAVNMLVKDVPKLADTASPVKPSPAEPDATTDIIFIKKGLFSTLFAKYDDKGHEDTTATQADVRPYRFLAHKRDINTEGMALAALTATEEDQSSYGVVFSHRTGPVTITKPTQIIAHLVSIRGVELMPWPVANDKKYVAMSSLHSWSYTCLPPDTPSIKDMFEALGRSSAMLRSNVQLDQLDPPTDAPKEVQDRVLQRLHDGYALARYRIQTGEQTGCFIRGPFIPVKIPSDIIRPWHSLSTSGSDLQILDQQLGLMDITYSAAWQIGRTLAISDADLVSRIGQVRKQIYDRGMHYYQLAALKAHGTRSKSELIAQLPAVVDALQNLHKTAQLCTSDVQARSRRWLRHSIEPVDLSYSGHEAHTMSLAAKEEDKLPQCFLKAAKEIASAIDPENPDQPSDVPYNEFNTPYSPDWMALLKFVLDKQVLENIPFHYLIPDISALPLESMRFFRIDWRWMDALLDGALSLSNYIDQDHDKVRDAIFGALKWYHETGVAEHGNEVPPVPVYGCLIRSNLIVKFPDMKVEVLPLQLPDKPPVLMRHKLVTPDTMLCLFSKEPSEPDFNGLALTQPPHQQTFVAGSDLKKDKIEMRYKKAYTADEGSDDVTVPIAIKEWSPNDPKTKEAVYLWDVTPSSSPTIEVRRLLMESLASDYLKTVQEKMDKKYFDDDTATSALMAAQMGSVAWRLKLKLSQINAREELAIDPDVSPSDAPLPEWAHRRRRHPLPSHAIQKLPQYYATRPVFYYQVSSTETPSSNTIVATDVEQDLIFRINLEPYTAGDYRLEELKIKVPFGTPQQFPRVLMATYKGSGADMTSNIRFNVMIDLETTDEKVTGMTLRMVPRSRRGYVPVTSCSEISFILSGVVVSQVTQKTWVDLEIKEHYANQGEWNPKNKPDSIVLVPPPAAERAMNLKRIFSAGSS